MSIIFQPVLRKRLGTLALLLTIGATGVALIILMMNFPSTGAYRDPVTSETLLSWAQTNGWWMPRVGMFAKDPGSLVAEIRNVLLPLGALFLICYLGLRRLGVSGGSNLQDSRAAGDGPRPNTTLSALGGRSNTQGPFWSAATAMFAASCLIVFNPVIMPLFVARTNSYEMINRSGDATGVLSQAIVYGLQAVILLIPLLLLISIGSFGELLPWWLCYPWAVYS